MKIVGWTEWGNPNYKEMFPIGGTYRPAEFNSVTSIIAEELRGKGYKFTGSYHQNGDFGVPIFDTGEVFQCTQRTWGSVMVKAYPDAIDNTDGLGYTVWAWIAPEPEIVPGPE